MFVTRTDEIISNNEKKKLKAIQGTQVSTLKQLLLDMSFLFCKKLNIIGVGFRVSAAKISNFNLLHFKARFNQSGSLSLQLIDAKSSIMFRQDLGTILNSYDKDILMENYPSGVFYMKVFFKPIVGSVKTGKDADLVLWTDNPLSIYATVNKTFVDGKLIFDAQKQTEKDEMVKNEKNRIIQKMLLKFHFKLTL